MKKNNLIFNINNFGSFSKISKKAAILIELKCGTTCNGSLEGIDDYFNVLLNKVIITAPNGHYFKEALIVLIKGKTIRCVRML